MNMILEQNEIQNDELESKNKEYMDYLEKHISGVVAAFKKYFLPLVETFKDGLSLYTNHEFILAIKTAAISIDKHDLSKYNDYEFYPYRRHFYPTIAEQNCSDEEAQVAEENYEKAWTHHYENNMHHIEYWYDFSTKTAKNMPLASIVEMICDWISMLQFYPKPEIDTWWNTDAEDERSKMIPETISTVNEIFAILKK